MARKTHNEELQRLVAKAVAPVLRRKGIAKPSYVAKEIAAAAEMILHACCIDKWGEE